jgi:hypothetical protein
VGVWAGLEAKKYLDLASQKTQDAFTSFDLFSKSSHPIALLKTRDGESFKKLGNDLGLLRKGFSSIYLFDAGGNVSTYYGQMLNDEEVENVAQLLLSSPPSFITPDNRL